VITAIESSSSSTGNFRKLIGTIANKPENRTHQYNLPIGARYEFKKV